VPLPPLGTPRDRLALMDLNQLIVSCNRCQLSESRNKAVPGSGFSGICLIGEAPGYYEDQKGLPFVGKSGEFLSTLLKRCDLTRKDIWVGNVLKCRPSAENRDPTDKEVVACTPWLEEQLQALVPDLIILTGRFSTKLFFPNARISDLHGKMRRLANGTLVYVTYHPAAALHDPRKRAVIEEDFTKLKPIIKNLKRRK
jgi:DNA polymerase